MGLFEQHQSNSTALIPPAFALGLMLSSSFPHNPLTKGLAPDTTGSLQDTAACSSLVVADFQADLSMPVAHQLNISNISLAPNCETASSAMLVCDLRKLVSLRISDPGILDLLKNPAILRCVYCFYTLRSFFRN